MDFTNLYHRVLLHYGIAAVAGLAVLIGVFPDTRDACLIALTGWLAFCMAGYLSLRYDEQIFDQPLNSRLKDRRSHPHQPSA